MTHQRETDRNAVRWHVRYDDVDGALSALEHFAAMTQADRVAMGRRGADLIRDRYSRTTLRDAFSNIVCPNGGAVPDRS